ILSIPQVTFGLKNDKFGRLSGWEVTKVGQLFFGAIEVSEKVAEFFTDQFSLLLDHFFSFRIIPAYGIVDGILLGCAGI
ncbi:hypothetical protein B4N84_21150, partial [Flavobacterium sp. IR1]